MFTVFNGILFAVAVVVLAAGYYYLTFVMTDPNPKASATWMPTASFMLKTLKSLKVTLEHDADETTVMKDGTATINPETCAALGFDFDELSETLAPYCTKIEKITTATSFDDLK